MSKFQSNRYASTKLYEFSGDDYVDSSLLPSNLPQSSREVLTAAAQAEGIAHDISIKKHTVSYLPKSFTNDLKHFLTSCLYVLIVGRLGS